MHSTAIWKQSGKSRIRKQEKLRASRGVKTRRSFSAAYALELHHWKETEALPLITPIDDADASITYKARAIGATRSANLPVAHANLQAIQDSMPSW